MPPRRSARVADAVERQTSPLAPLPLQLVHRIFLTVPVDSRGRAACVARGWRDVLADPALWTRLNLSGSSGVSYHMLTRHGDALLRGAAGRSRGQLCELDVTSQTFPLPALLEVVTANAGSLRVLRSEPILASYPAMKPRSQPWTRFWAQRRCCRSWRRTCGAR